MAKKLLFCLAVLWIVGFTLLGCGPKNDDLRFAGGTANWAAEYTVTFLGDGYHKDRFALTDLGGEEIQGNIQYEFDHGIGGGSADTPMPPRSKTVTSDGDGNSAPPTKDSEVQVIVHWNGKTERFALSADHR
ncbi:hypothetical protein [Paenibacillus thermotolerans]|uniref:hypothetical protein n=1 Tax=Paenibacillus thermotolerans TaxID=3027807 RepID=UPI0023681478|nr:MULTISPECIES: hypothetical protein [unclassified Paenibacillus]